ncbi:MAG: ABC transporter ATP-binding protein/permease [Tissierellales bacterium]|nr:ABC transporter ATP-binding protein/permease [Tissierellales bacterium]
MKKYIFKIKFEILLQILFSIVESLSLAALAYLPKVIFDLIAKTSTHSTNALFTLIVLFCVLSFVSVGASYLQMIFIWKYAVKFENLIKSDYFSAIMRYDDIKFHQRDISEYVSIQSNDIMQIEQDYLTPIVSAINQMIKIIVFGIVMFVGIDWRIASVVFVSSLISAVLPKYTGAKTASKRLVFVEKLGNYTNLIYDFFNGFREINTRNEKNIIKENEKALSMTRQSRYNYGKNKSISLAINRLTRTIVQLLGFIMVIILLNRGEISIGTCIATLGFINSFIEPLEEVLYCFTTIETVKDVKNKVFDLLSESKIESKITKKNFDSKLEIQNLSVKNGSFALKNISLTFEKNKRYAIVGHNGCGKSTLLNSIMGYIKTSSGEILVDKKPLSMYNTEWLINYTLQKAHVFSNTYENNITMFGSYSDLSEQTLDNIGLSSKIVNKIKHQKNASNLSGGEKQILSYIRARNSNTPILLMDEPFSAVDQKSKQLLMKDIASLHDKTIIMITHDLDESLLYFDEVVDMGKLLLASS